MAACCTRRFREKERDRLQRQWYWRHGRARIELPIRQRAARFGQRETNQVRSGVAPKRIGLRRPVHVAERGGVAVEVVFRPLVVGDDHLFGRCISPEKARSFRRTWIPR